MHEFIIAQVPPTPTPMMVPTAQLSVPQFHLWDSTDEIIQIWQSNSSATTGIQYLLIAAIVVAALFMVMYLLNRLGEGNDK